MSTTMKVASSQSASSKTIRLTMAQALVRFLDNQYVACDGKEYKFVKGIMGIFGHGNATGLGEALEFDSGNLEFMQGKNEQGMVHTAVAYAKQKNRLGIYACTSSIGPGALNMVTGAATATANHIPVLLLPGDNFACRQPDPVLQQIEHTHDYTMSTTDAFKPVSRYWDRIERPEQIMVAAIQAMRVLTDPVTTGAVTLALPQDVQAEAYDYPLSFFEKRVHHIDRRLVTQREVESAIELIMKKKKPLLIVGGGIHYSMATQELMMFAERFNIPVAETQAGKSALPWNHPLNVGAIGVTGSLCANRLAKEADLIMAVGTRLGDFATASKYAFQNPNVHFLGINVGLQDAMKMDAVKVVADAKEALNSLTTALQEKGYRSDYADELNFLREEWNQEVDRLYSIELPEGLSQLRALGEINGFVEEQDVVVCAAGSLPGDLHRLWKCQQPKTYHLEYGFSCMGYEVAGALGVKLAEPKRNVYALVGDGSYLMLHSELVTSLQENKKITIILFNNHGYQCIQGLQKAHGSEGFGNEFRHRTEKGLSGEYLGIDFAAHAKALGATSYKVHTLSELQEALCKAREEDRTTLIEVNVVPGSQSGGYESWWRVGVAEVSKGEKVLQAYQEMDEKIKKIKTKANIFSD